MKDVTYKRAAVAALCAFVAISIAALLHPYVIKQGQATYSANGTLPVGGATYNLSGAGISSSATSITLSSLTLPQNGYKIQDSDLSNTFYITVEPGNRSRQEFVSCTTVVQNSAGTATLSGCTRGLSPVTPFTASSSLQFAHPGGAQVVFSDPPQLFNEFLALANVATSTNILVFSSTTPPRYDSVAAQASGTYIATTSEFASITYVNAIAVSGAANATESVKGIAQLGTALQVASSTSLGSSAASLVLQAKNATDTPQYGCATGYTGTAGAGCSVVALLTGKLHQSWLDLTASFSWSGTHTFAATTTDNSGAVFSSTAAKPFSLNSVFAYFNLSGAGIGQFLTITGGAGTGASPYVVGVASTSPAVLMATTTATQTTSSATTTLQTIVIPTGTFAVGTDIIRYYVTGDAIGGICHANIIFGTGAASTTIGYGRTGGTSFVITGTLIATSTASEYGASFSYNPNGGGQVGTADPVSVTPYTFANYPAASLAANTYLAFAARVESASACKINSILVERYR